MSHVQCDSLGRESLGLFPSENDGRVLSMSSPIFFKRSSQQSTDKTVHTFVCLPVHPSDPSIQCVLCQGHWSVSKDTNTNMTPDSALEKLVTWASPYLLWASVASSVK